MKLTAVNVDQKHLNAANASQKGLCVLQVGAGCKQTQIIAGLVVFNFNVPACQKTYLLQHA